MCIDSIITHSKGFKYEIILVDNASSDGSKDHFEKDKRITYIYNSNNLGFGKANNIGLSHATGRNILFLNSDTLLFDNSIKNLCDSLDTNPKAGAVGGNLIDADYKPALSFQRIRPSVLWELNLLSLGLLSRLLYGKNRTYNFSNKPINVGYISGADLMIRKSVLDKTGGFSDEFFMYYEETDLCCRINNIGYDLIVTPKAKIIHLEGKSFGKGGKINVSRINTQETSRETYYKRNHSKIHHWIANSIYWLNLRINPFLLSIFGHKNQSQILINRRNALK